MGCAFFLGCGDVGSNSGSAGHTGAGVTGAAQDGTNAGGTGGQAATGGQQVGGNAGIGVTGGAEETTGGATTGATGENAGGATTGATGENTGGAAIGGAGGNAGGAVTGGGGLGAGDIDCDAMRSTTVPEDQAVELMAELYCSLAFDCECDEPIAMYASEEQCHSEVESSLASLQSDAQAQGGTYDGACAGYFLEYNRARGCEAEIPCHPPACAIYSGVESPPCNQGPPSPGGVRFAQACPLGTFCYNATLAGNPEPGTCREAVQLEEGDSCPSNSQFSWRCPEDTSCFEEICRPRQEPGGTCTRYRDCVDQVDCSSQVDGVCVARAARGESCESANCHDADFCSGGVCMARSQIGEACDTGLCLAGLICTNSVCTRSSVGFCSFSPDWL